MSPGIPTRAEPAARSAVLKIVVLLLFGATLLYELAGIEGLTDDHFMHVAWGRQLLGGDLPLRDMVPLGMPLQEWLSAAAEGVIGYRLLSEGAVVSLAFATGAVATFLLARLASGSIFIGAMAAMLQVAMGPRSYSYPKILVYAVGIGLLWSYVDRPSSRRAAILALAVVIAFYFRHDHGLYLGLVSAAVIALRHWHQWRTGVSRVGSLAAWCVLGAAPLLVYVALNGGLGTYLGGLAVFARREHQQNHFETWPHWPLVSTSALLRWEPAGPNSITIGVRWSADSAPELRREAAARHGLRSLHEGPLESGPILLTDISRDNVLALINEPAIEDTSGLDRATGLVEIPGLWIGPVHVLPALDGRDGAASCLYFEFLALLPLTLVLLVPDRSVRPLGEWERIKVGAALLVAVVTAIGFLREPLAERIADWSVGPLVLAAWCAGWLLDRDRRPAVRWACAALSVLLFVTVARSAVVVGGARSRLQALGFGTGRAVSAQWVTLGHRLWTSPPFDAWDSVGSVKYRVARYVRDCSPERERLLVLWFAPDLYYYSGRRFAGRQGFYMEGYWSTEADERANLISIERERPVLALSELRHEQSDLTTYPLLRAYLANAYHTIGELQGNDGSVIRVLARNDRRPSSTDAELGWPCYRGPR